MSNDPKVLSALERYGNAVRSVQDDIDAHKDVFSNHERLVGAVIDARTALEDVAAETAEEGAMTVTSNGDYKVTVTPQMQTVYDEEKILAALYLTREQALSQRIITENKRPPRISIGTTPVAHVAGV